MKKFLTAFVSMVAIVALCVCMAGCATDVTGKTYVYDHAEISTEKELDEVAQAAAELVKAGVNKTFKDSEIVFSAEDDGVTVGGIPYKYEQNGAEVTIKTLTGGTYTTANASGKTLTRTYEQGGYTFKLVYNLK